MKEYDARAALEDLRDGRVFWWRVLLLFGALVLAALAAVVLTVLGRPEVTR